MLVNSAATASANWGWSAPDSALMVRHTRASSLASVSVVVRIFNSRSMSGTAAYSKPAESTIAVSASAPAGSMKTPPTSRSTS